MFIILNFMHHHFLFLLFSTKGGSKSQTYDLFLYSALIMSFGYFQRSQKCVWQASALTASWVGLNACFPSPLPNDRSKHQRCDPRLQHHRAQYAASLHAAHPSGKRPHGLRLPLHDHRKIQRPLQTHTPRIQCFKLFNIYSSDCLVSVLHFPSLWKNQGMTVREQC